MQYVELHCKSNFSFLRGASHPHELVEQAAKLGYEGIALTDIETVAGVVRGFVPARDMGFKYIVGTEVHPGDAPPMVLWPTNRAAYGRMCRLISRGRMRCEKGTCELNWNDIVEFSEGIIAGVLPTAQCDMASTSRFLRLSFGMSLRIETICCAKFIAVWTIVFALGNFATSRSRTMCRWWRRVTFTTTPPNGC